MHSFIHLGTRPEGRRRQRSTRRDDETTPCVRASLSKRTTNVTELLLTTTYNGYKDAGGDATRNVPEVYTERDAGESTTRGGGTTIHFNETDALCFGPCSGE